jgi:ATP-dependent DNA helicase PIF1
LTGPGGTGKSHTIHAIVNWAIDTGLRVAVTALTGCAALLLSTGLRGARARTIHSWAGIGLGRETAPELVVKIKTNRRASRKWLDTQLLIVDEISMMTPDLLEKLDAIGRAIRKRPDSPFGGLQLVLSGDFCQLPPVQKASTATAEEAVFAFESPVWKSLVQETHYLMQIQRQRDPDFQSLLNEARLGRLSAESIKLLEDRMGLPWHDNEIRPTLLFSRNMEVNTINRTNLDALETPARTYDAQTIVEPKVTGSSFISASPEDPAVAAALERLDSDAPYDPRLELKEGAQVMLLTNKDQDKGLVNGSRGVITGFTLGGLPIVRFQSIADPVVVDREVWWLADYDGIGRSQIPLRVAYACTIHKSQGSSLDSALIDIGSATFEYGQAYVALSRVRSLSGLYVWKLDPRKIRCHPRVLKFYESIAPVSPDATDTPANHGDPQDPVDETVISESWATPWTTDGLSAAWADPIQTYMSSPKGERLRTAVLSRQATAKIAPAPTDVFAALRLCPDPATVRVIILGQDPYHTISDTGSCIAHGLAFSVSSASASKTRLPPSLTNIFKELASDLSIPSPPSADLSRWATQGVLLLNDILTVSAGAPLSHQNIGWEELTLNILQTVLKAAPHVVVIAWGRNAQKKLEAPAVASLLKEKHTLLTAPHPSPLSAHTGFFGSKPFSKTNAALIAHGQPPVKW